MGTLLKNREKTNKRKIPLMGQVDRSKREIFRGVSPPKSAFLPVEFQ
jgi:hypothetical protein